MIYGGHGIGENKEHYLYLQYVNDNDVELLEHLGFEYLENDESKETWVKYEEQND